MPDGAPSPSEQAAAYDHLFAVDAVLERLGRVFGRPDPFNWEGDARTGQNKFAGMILHIVSQQISTRVAFLLFDRIRDAVGGTLEPSAVAVLGSSRLQTLGLSAAKASYVHDFAQLSLSGVIDVEHLEEPTDEQAIDTLTTARGVGPWTAEMFLIAQLHRQDVLPAGDLGIRQAVMSAWSLPALPAVDEVRTLAQPWTPARTYAAALLWASRHRNP